ASHRRSQVLTRGPPVCRIWWPVASGSLQRWHRRFTSADPRVRQRPFFFIIVGIDIWPVSSDGALVLISIFMLFAQFHAFSTQVKYLQRSRRKSIKST
ncbi:hypothetical protein HAX54_010124, partial [Datura stramonium]|nr:hypothetical protein [Datura stramonium]